MITINYLKNNNIFDNFDTIINNINQVQYNIHIISFLLNKTQYHPEYFKLIIEKCNLNTLLEIKNNGIISLLFNYYIGLTDNNTINYIINFVQSHNIQLLKRDYLLLSKYNYYYNYNTAYYYFKTLLLIYKFNINQEDVMFLLNNNLYKLIEYLDGYFIKIKKFDIYNILPNDQYYKLKLYTIDQIISTKLLNFIENNIDTIILNKLEILFRTIKLNDNPFYILDAGNIIKGTLTFHSLMYLKKIIKQIKIFTENIIVIIHNKHTKNNLDILTLFNDNNILYYLTPYKINDDIFMFWFLFKFKCNAYIISNDCYKDHIFKFQEYIKNENGIDIYNILSQNILKYDKNYKVKNIEKYSYCIQISNNNIYIPTDNKNFIILKF